MRIEVVTRAELTDERLDALAAALAAANADPTQHVGYLDVEPAGVATELRELAPDTAFALGDGAAVLAAEWDLDLGRTWLYGPFAHGPQWADVADALYAAVKAHVPGAAGEHELFFDTRHERIEAFAVRHGFSQQGEHAIYTMDRADRPPSPAGVVPLPAALEPAFAALHDSAFPRTHASASLILDGDRHFRRPLAVAEGSDLLGYVAVTVEPELGSAHLEYVAVAPAAQGRGVGARLVAAGAEEAFADPRVTVFTLTVSTANLAAMRLYEKLGFTLERAMRAYRTR